MAQTGRVGAKAMGVLAGIVTAAAAFGGLAGRPAVIPTATAQTTASPEDVAAGMRIFRQKGDCQACHGWAADGRKMESQMPDGANLRATALDREQIVLVIKCGRPGRSMPAFDRLAYSDGRCYGMTQAAVNKVGGLPDPAATLQPREIEQVADFLFAKVIGKGPMTRAACIDYWSADVAVCKELPQ